MDLFADGRRRNAERVMPLAARVRPRTLDEFVGQRHFLAEGMLLRRLIDADRLTSVLFYGPPGTGKTTLGRLIADTTRCVFSSLNATSSAVKDVRAVLDAARRRVEDGGPRTLLFLDEIHRFNRAQQDVLLTDVEDGVVILVGATTENPFFAVNGALVSRSQIFQFLPLDAADVAGLVQSAAADPRAFGDVKVAVDDAAAAHLARVSDGDARRALSALEVAVLSEKFVNGGVRVTLAAAEQSIQTKALRYDKVGDQHYDHASAFIKSLRGGDADAGVYWLARMLEAGEDPRFLARRLAIFASEDVGNADPRALVVASAAFDVVTRVGLPECRLALAQATIYMATAPKSRATNDAIARATRDVEDNAALPVPRRLQDAHYAGARRLRRGPAAAADEPADYFGVDATYYEPADSGEEAALRPDSSGGAAAGGDG